MAYTKGSLESLRNQNRKTVLEIIKKHEPVSRAEISRILKMSRSNVSIIVDELIREGMVKEGQVGESSGQGGRRPVQLQFVADAKYALGIDVGATKTIFLLVNLRGDEVHHEKLYWRNAGGDTIEHLIESTRDFISESGVDVHRIVGTGVGIPGTINHSTGELIHAPGLNWNNVKLEELLSSYLPKPVFVDNDVNMGAIGERWKGAGIDYRDLAFVAVGTGIGAGLIINQQVHRGAHGFAGEIGYFQIAPLNDEAEVDITHFGPLEHVASGQGIENQVKNLRPQFEKSILDDLEITAENVFKAAEDGDPLANKVIDDSIRYLSFAIANIVTLFDPDIVLIGGGVAQAGEKFLSKIQNRIRRLVPFEVHLSRAGLGESAAAYGAAASALLGTDNLVLDPDS